MKHFFLAILLVSSAEMLLSAAESFIAPGTREMAARLERIIREASPMKNIYRSTERSQMLRAALAANGNPALRQQLQPKLAIELLQAGESRAAIQEFESFDRFMEERRLVWGEQNRKLFTFLQALSHFRLGEQENCLLNHSSDACLVPIGGNGFHQKTQGSLGAIRVLEEHLEKYPDDLRSRWLLNLAAMTLDQYPSKVSERWRIPPGIWKSDYDIKRFTDVAVPLGLDVNELSGGSVTEDFDRDGDLDVMVSSFGLRDQLRVFINNGDGSFTERTKEAGLSGELGGLNLVQADYNNDGHVDVLVLRGAWLGAEGKYPNSLLRNNGDGTFSDVTVSARMLSLHPTQTAVWFDFNLDGWVDLFVGNESGRQNVSACELYRNNKDGTFTECAAAAGVADVAFIKGVASGDYDNNGLPDVYVSRRGLPNILYRNLGGVGDKRDAAQGWRFKDVAATAGVTEPLLSFPTWFFDYDNDGWLDLFVADNGIKQLGDAAADHLGLETTAERSRLFRNKGDGTFEDVTKRMKLFRVLLAMGANYGDLDNDGWLDFYVANGEPNLSTLIPNRMFRNAGGKVFQDVTTSGGFGHLQKGHGVSFADLDNDGDQDVHTVMGGAYSGDVSPNVLFLNPGHGNRWITLELEGTRSNRSAIGARIKVTVETTTGIRVIHRVVGSGGSFGASPLRQEIGLGDAKSIASVEIRWSGISLRQVVDGLALDKFYKVTEGKEKAELLQRQPMKFPMPSAHGHHHPGK